MTTTPLTPVSWAEHNALDPLRRDCVTAVTLKILDKKCKMPVQHQEAMLAIYDVLHHQPGELFGREVYRCIEDALQQHNLSALTAEQIHRFRVEAEQKIPKPVMKAFKVRLREELFGQNPDTGVLIR
jgi:hypothetical protein